MFDYKFKRSFSMWKKVQGVKEVWWEKLYQKNICHKDEWKNESCMSIKLLLFLSASKLLYPALFSARERVEAGNGIDFSTRINLSKRFRGLARPRIPGGLGKVTIDQLKEKV